MAMFSSQTPADKLATALSEYQADFEKKLRSQPNPDAEEARQRISRAEQLVRQSGLGKALETLLEHTKYWPSWSKRDDFRKWVGFPVGEVLAKEQRDEKQYRTTSTTVVCFLYGAEQYAIVFTDNGGMSLPDGEYYRSGTVDFVAGRETVLGLNLTQESNEYTSDWRYCGVYALKMGVWSKALLEMASHIRAHSRDTSIRHNDERTIAQAKNISV
ncbi:hypothetical protein [Bradyrhizobium guangdongense]|uniref:Uncharacterized protein n=2 Tax=Bradyrhizobium guangdongense TaxID=1325090 RepID=A0ABX6URN4_9BRAD|nr:hypothetical protein [Bradyrhizobium guangdongense]QAU41616.1 hypothetical protein X265_30990 [Bradyrhizobium guangdongense]QOZ62679.1 hypothetical protein XH86_31030 [Bradyrhizobium guangdongense]